MDCASADEYHCESILKGLLPRKSDNYLTNVIFFVWLPEGVSN